MLLRFVLFILFCSSYSILQSQKIYGYIKDDKSIPLSFATIQVKNTDIGVVSNADGYFDLALEPGNYSIRFQFVGYRTKDTTIAIGNEDVRINIMLRPESLTLPVAVITGDNEDPAYTIMRRTIAKAPYHANQIDQYHARVYLKGSGRILKIPFLFRNRIKKEMAKEGIDSTIAFTQESISKLSYKRPGQYKDTVLSIKTAGDDNNTDPMSFVASSFYDAKVATAVSPLAANAFSVYNFEYLGFIEDHGSVINKIKVTPKSKGDQVFEGIIYITDQLWNIHSLQLTTSIWGIEFAIKQVYAPVQTDVWMPIDQVFDVGGNIFGFGFEYKYLAHLSNYKITLNPEIQVPILVLDDKLEKTESVAANEKIAKAGKDVSILGLDPNQEISAKNLKKMMKEYKKKELDSIPEVENIEFNANTSIQVIDSAVYKKRDSVEWELLRPVALTAYEIKGYSRLDSVSKVQAEKKQQEKDDSTVLNINLGSDGANMNIAKSRQKFEAKHLLWGGKFDFNAKKNFISLTSPFLLLNFNTVEGFYGGYKLIFGNNIQKGKNLRWRLSAEAGYSLAREKINYEIDYELSNVRKAKQKNFVGWQWRLYHGEHPFSFNPALPRGSYLNTYASIMLRRNLLKLYGKNFLGSTFNISPSPMLKLSTSLNFENRSPFENNTDWSLFKRNREYGSNIPENTLLKNVSQIAKHSTLLIESSVAYTPFYRYRVANGVKAKDRSISPTFTFTYKGGFVDQRFDLVQLKMRDHLSIGTGSDFDFEITTGTFFNKPEFFQDFAHFNGNEYIYSPSDPIKFFRALPYYKFSTNGNYLSLTSNYQFRKFLVSYIPAIRKKGIRENIILNSLYSKGHTNYSELGYSINYLFRFLRLEAISSWQDYKYQRMHFRFGVATGFDKLFNF